MKAKIKKNYHIMTSCDENLIDKLAVLIYSISRNIPNAHTDFYVLSREKYEKCEMLAKYCESLQNITFHHVMIPDAELYDELGKYGGEWPGEAYFSLCAHSLKEFENVDRAMYLDAGDVIIANDIAPFYNSDFNNKSLIIHPARFKIANDQLVNFERDDMQGNGFASIARGLLNSGSYMMNLKKMRDDRLTIDDYLFVKDSLADLFGRDNHNIYFGDQGLISIAFVGDIQGYRYDEIRSIWYMPYNFCMWYYDSNNAKPDYDPAVIHFAGNHKPWKIDYPIFLERFQNKSDLHNISELKLGQAEWYYLWHEYAMIADKQLTSLGY